MTVEKFVIYIRFGIGRITYKIVRSKLLQSQTHCWFFRTQVVCEVALLIHAFMDSSPYIGMGIKISTGTIAFHSLNGLNSNIERM